MAFDPLNEISRLPAGTLLMLGSRCHAVALVRRALAVHGLGPYSWRNFNKAVGETFTDSVRQAVVVFQRRKGLEADGIVGPLTLRALGTTPGRVALGLDEIEPLRAAAREASGDGLERAVVVARAALELHVRESGGQNHGPLVEALQLYAAGSRYFPWCAAFCDVCLRLGFAMAAQELPLSIGVSCSSLVRRAAADRRVYELVGAATGQYPLAKAQPGDLMVLRGGDRGFRHIGLVVEPQLADSSVPTIEGNTNDAGSAEGDGVYLKHRNPRRTPSVFITLRQAAAADDESAPQHIAAAPPATGTPGDTSAEYRGPGAGLSRLIQL